MSGISKAFLQSGIAPAGMSANQARELRRETPKNVADKEELDFIGALNRAQEMFPSPKSQEQAQESAWQDNLDTSLEEDMKNGAFVEYHPETSYGNWLSRLFDYSDPQANNDDDPRLEAA